MVKQDKVEDNSIIMNMTELILASSLVIFVIPTIFYHLFDIVRIFHTGNDNYIFWLSAKYREGLECRDTVLQDHDEFCFTKYDKYFLQNK